MNDLDFYYVDIPRTGSTSMRQALGVNGDRHMHLDAKERRRRVGENAWEEAWTFTVVRHPFEKVVSQFLHRQKIHDIDATPRNFERWVRWRYVEMDRFGRPDTDYWPKMWKPQWWWISDKTGQIVDTVYRFCNLQEAWEDISGRLEADPNLPHANKGEANSRWPELHTEETLQVVRNYFAVDFEHFGFAKAPDSRV